MEEGDLIEDDFGLDLPIIVMIISFVFFACFCLKALTKKQAKMDIDTIFVNQPELGIEKTRFYLVKNLLDYGLVQFKDINDDKKLDKVFHSQSEIPFSPDAFNPDMGFPGKDVLVSDPNSSDWKEWLKRFDLALKEHAEKQKQQKRFN